MTDGDAIAASPADPRAFGVIFERHFGAIHCDQFSMKLIDFI